MSNNFVFGAAFHMDVILWGLRNIVRTFVNFLVWFWFLKIILSALMSMDIKGMATDMLRLFLAAILIQSSRFIMSATVDMGTAATAAVWWLAQTVFADDRAEQKNYLLAPQEVKVKEGGLDERYWNFTISGSTDFTLEQVLPNADSVSGPLLFMWMSILEFTKATTLSTDAQWEISQKATKSFIKLMVIIMYIIPIVLLAIVSVVRLVRLRLWIILSPLIMFDRAMKVWWWSGGLKWLTEKINATPGEVLWLVFVPAAVVWCMSIWLILVVSIYGVIEQRWDYSAFNTETLSSTKPATIQWWASATAQVDGSLFKDVWYRSAGIVWELILAIFTIAMLRWLLKVWFSVSSITQKIAEQAFGAVKTFAMTTPILPLWDYGSISAGAMKWGRGAVDNMAKFMWLNKEQRDENNEVRSKEITWKLGINDSYDISLSTLNNVRALNGFATGTPWSLTAAQKEIVNDKYIGKSGAVEYNGKIERMIWEWLNTSTTWNTAGYAYIQNLLPAPDKGTMTQEEFVSSPYMTRFLKYVFAGNNVENWTSLRAALQDTSITGAAKNTRYDVK